MRARPLFGSSYSNATVLVSLVDSNDNAPTFEQFEYNTSVAENLPPMSQIYRLAAADLDSALSLHSQVRYKLLNQLDLFYVQEKTGWVYNKLVLDATSSRDYLLKIQVSLPSIRK